MPFYERASLVVNLTLKNMAVETFGLTALEAMTMGLPVIVPTVGGIAEMVEEGVTGYHIDADNLEQMAQWIEEIMTDRNLYEQLARSALKASRRYGADKTVEQIAHILTREK